MGVDLAVRQVPSTAVCTSRHPVTSELFSEVVRLFQVGIFVGRLPARTGLH